MCPCTTLDMNICTRIAFGQSELKIELMDTHNKEASDVIRKDISKYNPKSNLIHKYNN